MLSEYFSGIRGTSVDTEVYIFEGEEPGGTMFIIGSNHPVEPAGLLTQVLLVENARVKQGRLIVIPRSMASGYTATELARPPGGLRDQDRLRRKVVPLRNAEHQPDPPVPDPDVFVNWSSGQKLAGAESGNLNRNFPGAPTAGQREAGLRHHGADTEGESRHLHRPARIAPCPAVNSTPLTKGLDMAHATMPGRRRHPDPHRSVAA